MKRKILKNIYKKILNILKKIEWVLNNTTKESFFSQKGSLNTLKCVIFIHSLKIFFSNDFSIIINMNFSLFFIYLKK